MYNAFFGFNQNPFNMSPDPSFLFRSAQHEEALANLIYGVQSRKGFIALTGEVGTGKTTMLECLRDFLNSQQVAFASLFNSRLTVEQFFEMLAYDLDLRCNRLSKTEVLLSLNNMLLERAGAGRNTVLIVDEAHNLEWDVLEEIRLLGNLENRKTRNAPRAGPDGCFDGCQGRQRSGRTTTSISSVGRDRARSKGGVPGAIATLADGDE